jgi:putative acetyltransferase
MLVTVRNMRSDEGGTFLEIHNRSIRGLAAQHYPPDVIGTWVVPVTEENVRSFLKNPEWEIRLIAELYGDAVGLGVLVLRTSELRACYVVPEAARKGVGSALVRKIERIAWANNLTQLDLDASSNAEPFYTALGYEVIENNEHVLRSGQRISSVKMRKHLAFGGVYATADSRARDRITHAIRSSLDETIDRPSARGSDTAGRIANSAPSRVQGAVTRCPNASAKSFNSWRNKEIGPCAPSKIRSWHIGRRC